MSRDGQGAAARRRAVLGGLLSPIAGSLAALSASTAAAAPSVPSASSILTDDPPPPEPRQFRAAWVATVANIDWPSRPGLPSVQQQAEARAILDRARALGLNALVLQVRPAGDALYASRLEPWSEVLSGRQGQPPRPWWDPLAFWVREAHARGLALHAWFNPFRARHSSAKSPLARPHLALRAPQAVKVYGDQLWMDPGDATARAHTLAVIEDVLRRYDVDGVHIDDYFYPYPVVQDGTDLAFPDSEAYLRYLAEGGMLPLPDWRRAHVDTLVQELHARVRRVKPRVPLGISPFGLGRPDRRPPGVTGFSQYDKLFADVERWLEMGWLDYLAPQLYWRVGSAGQPFPALVQHWVQANVRGRHLWPGLFASAVRGGPPTAGSAPASAAQPATWPARELLEQVALLERSGIDAAQGAASGAGGGAGGGATSGAGSGAGPSGHILFSVAALMQDRDGLATLLRRGPYATPALVPATPWLDDRAPPAPRLVRRAAAAFVEPARGAPAVAAYAVWWRIDGRWRFGVRAPGERLLARERADAIVVSAVDRLGNVSERRVVSWP